MAGTTTTSAGGRDAPPDDRVVVEESTPHHWVGSAGNVVLAFAYPGSQQDVRHVLTTARVVGRVRQDFGRVRVLVVLPSEGGAPDARVRGAIVKLVRAYEAKGEERDMRFAIVLRGTSFHAAIHRGVVSGILALRSWDARMFGDLRAALRYVVEGTDAPFDALAAACDARVVGPA
jgi:hypothetical protein